MVLGQYKITIKTPATLVYYVSEYDAESAIGLAMEAPYKEWEVSDFQDPDDSEINVDFKESY